MASSSRKSGPIPFNAKYGGPFENAMNVLYSPTNIAATAAKVSQLETPGNLFMPGKFNQQLLQAAGIATPASFDFSAFQNDFNTIPLSLRQKVADVMRANFQSPNPCPVLVKVSENVDDTHDVIIKAFVNDEGRMYIGILYLCPNSTTPPP